MDVRTKKILPGAIESVGLTMGNRGFQHKHKKETIHHELQAEIDRLAIRMEALPL
jgi:hypothetical protein